MDNPITTLLQARHATRSIAPEALPDAQLDELVAAAGLAPSCFNKQPWRLTLATSPEARARVCAALSEGNRAWACRAPLLVIAAARAEDDCQLPDGRAYYQFDLGLAVMNLMLAATARDLVARPMAGFDPAAIAAAVGLDPKLEPLVVLAVGRPDPDESHLPERLRGQGDKPRQRKAAAEIARRV